MDTRKVDMGYKQLYQDLINRILKGKGYSRQEERQAAFDNSAGLPPALAALTHKVAYHAYKITDTDIAAVKSAGFNDDQVFELIICAAAGQAARQYENGLAALAGALKEGGAHAS